MPRRGASSRAAEPTASARACDAPGCTQPGEFKAPRSRSKLNDYVWFCLPHVREYNMAWDYYRGMQPAEIEAHVRDDTAWGRPTWPLGRLGASRAVPPDMLRDPLGVLRGTRVDPERRRAPQPPPRTAPPELRAALDVLGLVWPTDGDAVRTRFRELAKRYHPDLNQNDPAAEERFKDVNRAYGLLRQRVPAADVAAAAG